MAGARDKGTEGRQIDSLLKEPCLDGRKATLRGIGEKQKRECARSPVMFLTVPDLFLKVRKNRFEHALGEFVGKGNAAKEQSLQRVNALGSVI